MKDALGTSSYRPYGTGAVLAFPQALRARLPSYRPYGTNPTDVSIPNTPSLHHSISPRAAFEHEDEHEHHAPNSLTLCEETDSLPSS